MSGKRLLRLGPEIALYLAFLIFWSACLAPWYGIPSIGDGLNHLGIFEALRKSGVWFFGHSVVPYQNEFGMERAFFYPAGAHAFLARVIAPWALKLCDSATLLQLALINAAAFIPVFLYRSIRAWLPELSQMESVALAAAFSLSAHLPVSAAAEGGFSRLFAQSLALGVAARLIRRPRFPEALVWVAVGLPALFYTHPSSVFVMGPPLAFVLWDSRPTHGARGHSFSAWLAPVLAAFGIAVVLTFAILKTGDQLITAPQAISKYQEGAPVSFLGALERLKSVFHFLFADALGFGKFFSPRSILAYLGIFALVKFARRPQRRPQPVLPLALPFLLSLLVFIPAKPFQLLSMLFYQQTKRMSEIALLPLTLVAALGWLYFKHTRLGIKKTSRWAAWVLLLSCTGVSFVRARTLFESMAAGFGSVRKSESQDLTTAASALESGAVIASDDRLSQALLSIRPDLLLVTETPECSPERPQVSEPCAKRMEWVKRVLSEPPSAHVLTTQQQTIRADAFPGRPVYALTFELRDGRRQPRFKRVPSPRKGASF